MESSTSNGLFGAALLWSLRPSSGSYRGQLITTAMVSLAGALVGPTVTVAPLALPKRGSYRVDDGRRWFLIFAGVSALAACALWVVGTRLTESAAG